MPPAIGLVTACLAPFMPGLPDSMGLIYRITLAIFGFISMTAITAIYLISFDNDHNQQAPVDGPEQARGDDAGPRRPLLRRARRRNGFIASTPFPSPRATSMSPTRPRSDPGCRQSPERGARRTRPVREGRSPTG